MKKRDGAKIGMGPAGVELFHRRLRRELFRARLDLRPAPKATNDRGMVQALTCVLAAQDLGLEIPFGDRQPQLGLIVGGYRR